MAVSLQAIVTTQSKTKLTDEFGEHSTLKDARHSFAVQHFSRLLRVFTSGSVLTRFCLASELLASTLHDAIVAISREDGRKVSYCDPGHLMTPLTSARPSESLQSQSVQAQARRGKAHCSAPHPQAYGMGRRWLQGLYYTVYCDRKTRMNEYFADDATRCGARWRRRPGQGQASGQAHKGQWGARSGGLSRWPEGTRPSKALINGRSNLRD